MEIKYEDINAVRNSDLSLIAHRITPKDYIDPTEAYKFGSLIDAMLTTPVKVNFITKKCNGIAYDTDKFNLAYKMYKELISNDLYRNFTANATYQKVVTDEVTLFYKNPYAIAGNGIEFSIKRKGLLDIYKPNIIADFKSTVATSQSQLISLIDWFDYDRQGAWYMDIAKVDTFVIIAISKVNQKIFRHTIKKGDEMYLRGVQKYTQLAYWWHVFNSVN